MDGRRLIRPLTARRRRADREDAEDAGAAMKWMPDWRWRRRKAPTAPTAPALGKPPKRKAIDPADFGGRVDALVEEVASLQAAMRKAEEDATRDAMQALRDGPTNPGDPGPFLSRAGVVRARDLAFRAVRQGLASLRASLGPDG